MDTGYLHSSKLPNSLSTALLSELLIAHIRCSQMIKFRKYVLVQSGSPVLIPLAKIIGHLHHLQVMAHSLWVLALLGGKLMSILLVWPRVAISISNRLAHGGALDPNNLTPSGLYANQDPNSAETSRDHAASTAYCDSIQCVRGWHSQHLRHFQQEVIRPFLEPNFHIVMAMARSNVASVLSLSRRLISLPSPHDFSGFGAWPKPLPVTTARSWPRLAGCHDDPMRSV
jgi:hypothetical protein